MSLPIQERPYFPTVEEFLKHLDQRDDIRCVCLVALTSRDDPAHCFCAWHCNPFDIMEVAGTLQLIATESYLHSTPVNDEDEQEDNEDEHPDDER